MEKRFYVVVDDCGVDVYNTPYNTLEEAEEAAAGTWEHLTKYDKSRREAFYILETDDPDFLDGDPVKVYK